MLKMIESLYKNEEGQGLVEYALILVLIAIAVIAALQLLGGKVKETFNNVNEGLDSR